MNLVNLMATILMFSKIKFKNFQGPARALQMSETTDLRHLRQLRLETKWRGASCERRSRCWKHAAVERCAASRQSVVLVMKRRWQHRAP